MQTWKDPKKPWTRGKRRYLKILRNTSVKISGQDFLSQDYPIQAKSIKQRRKLQSSANFMRNMKMRSEKMKITDLALKGSNTWEKMKIENKSWFLTLRKIPYFHLISWSKNFVEKHSFRIVSGKSPETMRKLCLSAKSPHQEIRWNYGIFRSVT